MRKNAEQLNRNFCQLPTGAGNWNYKWVKRINRQRMFRNESRNNSLTPCWNYLSYYIFREFYDLMNYEITNHVFREAN